jgi:hypothetical protein
VSAGTINPTRAVSRTQIWNIERLHKFVALRGIFLNATGRLRRSRPKEYKSHIGMQGRDHFGIG